MKPEYMEELVGLVVRIREIVDGDPSMPIRIGSAVSLLEAAVREQVESKIWLFYRDSERLKVLEGEA